MRQLRLPARARRSAVLAAGLVLGIVAVLRTPTPGEGEQQVATTDAPLAVFDVVLPSSDGRQTRLGSLASAKATVFPFVSTECPMSNGYVPTLNRIARKYADRGIALVAINSNDGQTLREIAAHRQQYQIEFDVLKDAGARFAHSIGATHAPQAAVVDSAGRRTHRAWGVGPFGRD